MIVKILGVIDLIAASLIILISWGLGLPAVLIWIFAIGLLVKSLFIFTLDIASFFDLFGGVMLILSIYFTVPKILLIIAGFLIFQKGFLSVVA